MEKYSTTIGMDLGDKFHQLCVLDAAGEIERERRIGGTKRAVRQALGSRAPAVVAIEAGTHSPWVSRLLTELGHRVLVANPRKLRMIWSVPVKTDRHDARMLARLARSDPRLLCPIEHRGPRAQADLAMLKARDRLVQTRTKLINHVRGSVKAMGHRLPSCSAPSFARKAPAHIPAMLGDTMAPLVQVIGELTVKIKDYDRRIEQLSRERYGETERLRQVPGVGPITALAFVLSLERPERFARSRSVGSFVGLTPRQDQSGEMNKQLRITKAGNGYLRRLLVSCAHYILGPFGAESALRRWGLKLAERGGSRARKRAVVAVARKLAVLLHRLWIDSAPYEPFPEPVRRRRSRLHAAA